MLRNLNDTFYHPWIFLRSNFTHDVVDQWFLGYLSFFQEGLRTRHSAPMLCGALWCWSGTIGALFSISEQRAKAGEFCRHRHQVEFPVWLVPLKPPNKLSLVPKELSGMLAHSMLFPIPINPLALGCPHTPHCKLLSILFHELVIIAMLI